jgi:hypothetical protein
MVKSYYIIKLGLDRISPAGSLVKTRNLVKKLTGNLAFPTPTPALATVTTACDALEEAINAYDANPGPGELLDRNLAAESVKGLYTDLGSYVQAVSNGDLEIIKTSGLLVRKSPSPIGELPAPQDLTARTTAYRGRLETSWKGVRGRSVYELQICTGDTKVEANWSLYALTTKNRHTADGLESDKVYFFRVIARGAAGASPVSDLASAKAA